MRIFKKKPKSTRAKLPPWEQIVETMFDKELDHTVGYEVVRVLYSADKTRRVLILQSESGYFTYRSEVLKAYDVDKLQYLSADSFPAYWLSQSDAKSIFDDMSTLMQELTAEPDYITYYLDAPPPHA